MNKQSARMLSLDGAGVVMFTHLDILMALERIIRSKTNNPQANLIDYFDLLTGTSSGAKAVALMTLPGKNGQPRYSLQEVSDIILTSTRIVIKRSRLLQVLSSQTRNTRHYQALLAEICGDTELKDLLKPILATAYDPNYNYLANFSQYFANKDSSANFHVKDVIHGSVAIPFIANAAVCRSLFDGKVTPNTFLSITSGNLSLAKGIWKQCLIRGIINNEGKIQKDVTPQNKLLSGSLQKYNQRIARALHRIYKNQHVFIDGGVFANNPTLYGLSELSKMEFPEHNIYFPDISQIITLSLGKNLGFYQQEYYNGKRNIHNLIQSYEAIFISSTHSIHQHVRHLYERQHLGHQYFRIAPLIKQLEGQNYPTDDISDLSPKNIAALHALTENYINNNHVLLEKLADQLIDNTKSKSTDNSKILNFKNKNLKMKNHATNKANKN